MNPQSVTIAPGQHLVWDVPYGARLQLQATRGGHPLQLVAVVAGDPRDRFSAANTLAINKSAYVTTDTALLSYFCLPMLRITRDDVGGHSLVPSPYPQTDEGRARGAMAIHLVEGLGRALALEPHQVPHPMQLFLSHRITPDGDISEGQVVGDPGAVVELTAEADLLVGILSNPHIAADGGDAIQDRTILVTLEGNLP